jgi:prevent-host-death family protein
MEDFQKIIPVSKAEREFLDLLKQMEQEGDTIALTRDGEAVGVMMPLSRYEAMQETIEILGDKEIIRALKTSQKDFQSGKIVAHEKPGAIDALSDSLFRRRG